MTRRKGLAVVALAGVVALLALGVACGGGTSTPSEGKDTLPSSPQEGEVPQVGVERVVSSGAVAPGYVGAPGYATSYVSGGNVLQAGIQVTGTGALTLAPDLAVLSLGVESRALTVEEARGQAAEAMSAVMEALKGFGLPDEDIQTQHFSIQPEYTWREVVNKETGARQGERVLVGYLVTNTVTAKVRDLDRTGEVLDAIARAGGDVIRINNVGFTVENPTRYEAQARELAVREAKAKAAQMAEWAGETLGKLIYLTEVSAPAPVYVEVVREAKVMAEGAPTPTPISPGELEVRVTVQALWGIQ